jgi:hypothetical protein
VEATVTGHRAALLGLFGVQDLEDYFNRKLADWMKEVETKQSKSQEEEEIPFIATVAPGNRNGALALARGAQASAAKMVPFRSVLIDISEVHYPSHKLLAEDFLCYMWRQLELEEYANKSLSHSSSQQEGTAGQGEGKKKEKDQHQQARCWYNRYWRWSIYSEKKKAIQQITKDTSVKGKIEEINKEIGQVNRDELKLVIDLAVQGEKTKTKRMR